jgi:hypothetical protein
MPRRYTKRNKRGGINATNKFTQSLNGDKYITKCRITDETHPYRTFEKTGNKVISCETVKKTTIEDGYNAHYNSSQNVIPHAQAIISQEPIAKAQQVVDEQTLAKATQIFEENPTPTAPQLVEAEEVIESEEPKIQKSEPQLQNLEPKIKFTPGELSPEEYTITLPEDSIKNPPSLSSSMFSMGKSNNVLSNFTFSVPLSKLLEIYKKDGELGKRKFNKIAVSKIVIKSGLIQSILFYYITTVDNTYYVNLTKLFTSYGNTAQPNKSYSMYLDFWTRQENTSDSSVDIIITTTNIDSTLNFDINFHIDKRDTKDKHRVLIIDSVKLNGKSLKIDLMKRDGYEYTGLTEKGSYDAYYKHDNKYYTTQIKADPIYWGNATANIDSSFTSDKFKDSFGKKIPLFKIGGKRRNHRKTKRRNYKKRKEETIKKRKEYKNK